MDCQKGNLPIGAAVPMTYRSTCEQCGERYERKGMVIYKGHIHNGCRFDFSPHLIHCCGLIVTGLSLACADKLAAELFATAK